MANYKHPVIAVSIDAAIVFNVVYAIVDHYQTLAASALAKRNATLAAASLHQSMLHLVQVIVTEHASELTTRRKQLTVTLSYGVVDDSKWRRDVEFFIEELIENAGADIRGSQERLQSVRGMIGIATAHYADSRVSFSLDMDPVDYEQMVADALTDLGWHTRVTKVSSDQGIDVIAEMHGKCVVI